MHRKIALCACILTLCLAVTASASNSVPLLVTQQGRLLNSDDTPVSGTKTLTVKLYEVPTGGVALWTEVHPSVTITEGLYSIVLGSITPMSSDLFSPPSSPVERYLSVTVDGAELMPRLRVGSVPYALSSSRMDGDIQTSPGELRTQALGQVKLARLQSSTNPADDGSSLELLDGGGSTTGTIRASSSTGGQLQLSQHSGSTTGTIRWHAADTDMDGLMDMDSDGDLVTDESMEMHVAPSTTSLAIKTKGTGAQRAAASTESWGDSSKSSISTAQGTSVPASSPFCKWIEELARPSGASHMVAADVDGDGLEDMLVRSSVTASGAGSILKGGMSGSTTGTIRMMATPDSTVDYLDADSDDDGLSDARIVLHITPRDALGTGGEARTQWYTDSDDDGFGDNSIECKTTPIKSTSTILGGHSGSTTGTIRMMASPDSGATTMDQDSDGDGVAESSFHVQLKDQYGNSAMEVDSDDDGVADNSSETTCDATGAVQSISAGHSGSTTGTIRMQTTSGGFELSCTKDAIEKVHIDGATGMVVTEGPGGGSCQLSPNGAALFSGNVVIGSVSSSHYIDVQGGAYCDGTTWANASDVASKENFKGVNGSKLLDQVADLKISRWNYKGQPDVDHIGPTAQDFQAVFGLGGSDKSISTVDPSGIALAAIQELQKQNAELREKLETLTRKVEALTATR